MNSGEKIIGRPELPSADAIDALALAQLIARVEAATTGDRETDARLYVSLIARLRNPMITDLIAERAASHPGENVWLDGARDWQVPRYTASLDAALALVERVLPGWRWTITTRNYSGTENQAPTRAAVWPGADGYRSADADAKTPALALILAMLRALAALAETPG